MISSVLLKRSITSVLKKECRLFSAVASTSTFTKDEVSLKVGSALKSNYVLQKAQVVDFQKRSFFSTPPAADKVPTISDSEVTNLFNLWNDALATLDADTVAKRYATTSVLLPTVSDTPRTDYDAIKAYFVDFLAKKPQGVILESNVIQCGGDFCMDAGIYEFTMGATGDKVKARYSYVYQFEDGEWKIAHHHSSIMPESHL